MENFMKAGQVVGHMYGTCTGATPYRYGPLQCWHGSGTLPLSCPPRLAAAGSWACEPRRTDRVSVTVTSDWLRTYCVGLLIGL